MTESQIGFLFNAALFLSKSTHNRTQVLLKSYYLLRCKEITNRLPQKLFSKSSRCPRCCVEWDSKTETKVKQLQLSKKQKRRIRLRKKTYNTNKNEEKPLEGNVIEKTCSFCNHKTSWALESNRTDTSKNIANKIPQVIKKENLKLVPTNNTSVYLNSKQAFSLANQSNTLASVLSKQTKEIKNNKKKKDKFAGLCQKAVLSVNQMKQNKEKQNKLNLFLKPST